MTCTDDIQSQVCWLCLSGPEAGQLSIPCKCPALYSHPACLARWQLQQAGREEERFCRFCNGNLPTWAQSLLDEPTAAGSKPAVPIMAVVFNNRMVKLPCIPGREGAELFKKQVRQIFNLDESVNLDVTFELKVPTLTEDHGSKVYLKGFHTFEAASTVAAICAAKRQHRKAAAAAAASSSSSQTGQLESPFSVPLPPLPRDCASDLQGMTPSRSFHHRSSSHLLALSSPSQSSMTSSSSSAASSPMSSDSRPDVERRHVLDQSAGPATLRPTPFAMRPSLVPAPATSGTPRRAHQSEELQRPRTDSQLLHHRVESLRTWRQRPDHAAGGGPVPRVAVSGPTRSSGNLSLFLPPGQQQQQGVPGSSAAAGQAAEQGRPRGHGRGRGGELVKKFKSWFGMSSGRST